MERDAHIDCILGAMAERRELVKGVLGKSYPERVAVYVKTVKAVMADKNINEISAMFVIMEDAKGRLDPKTCALIAAASLHISEEDSVDCCEHKEGLDHG